MDWARRQVREGWCGFLKKKKSLTIKSKSNLERVQSGASSVTRSALSARCHGACQTAGRQSGDALIQVRPVAVQFLADQGHSHWHFVQVRARHVLGKRTVCSLNGGDVLANRLEKVDKDSLLITRCSVHRWCRVRNHWFYICDPATWRLTKTCSDLSSSSPPYLKKKTKRERRKYETTFIIRVRCETNSPSY